jgi:hypothetical protein
MGLEANYPAVTMNDPQGHVTVVDQDFNPVGTLGPSPYESPSVNVVCRLVRPDGTYWYRLLNVSGFSTTASTGYVPAAETHELNPGQPYPIPDCSHVGCAPKAAKALGIGIVAAGAAAAFAKRRKSARG